MNRHTVSDPSRRSHANARLNRRGALLLALTVGATGAQASSSTVEWSFGVPQTMALGVGAGDPTFNRLGTDCGQLSGTGTAVRYDTIVVTNNGPRAAQLDVRTQPIPSAGTPICSAARDTVMAVYSAFNPAAPTAGCLAFNDNIDGTTACSRISGVTVARGASVTVVVSSAVNGTSFQYDLLFDGSTYGASIFLANFEPSERFIGHGMAATGQFTVDSYPAPFAVTSRLNGGVARETGEIQGRLALAPVQLQDIATGIGLLTLRLQMWQNGSGGGQLLPNNTATLGATDLFLRLQHVTANGNPVDIGGDCQFGPITWALAGNADANSIDLTQDSFVIPPGAPTACNNLGSQLNGVLAGSDNDVTMSLER